MLKALRSFLSELTGADEERRFSEDDHRLAAAALLYHVIAVDGSVSEKERTRLHDLLKARYALAEEETEDLIREAETADDEAVDLYRFTSILKDRLDDDGREQIIAMMWDLVYQDDHVHEFEENVIWRVAELLGVSSRERIRLKKIIQSGGAPVLS
ncbi:TerB family tellurite resistance protein [Kaistia dalseonensis]|uniref:Tellurite resistance protein B-like protein n=1 Tax=Kaistia dalseonensis TaxID=410840 RepID=A0ABU0H5N3_9HYPH|nr:TerB family tellurite resistance protein [Kaistia dalseonensis]MCX5495029.1 TerB family tellurite resistance protein [Kaistia dalseonensis]MDQ0437611.1 putative tellurite resistance protein B-like protein [Kaistia dalseonensis]